MAVDPEVVARIDAVPDFEVDCGLCTDIAFQRLLVGGEWRVETMNGVRRFGAEPILMGPQSRFMPVRCKGAMSALGVGFRPGALRKLVGIETAAVRNLEPHAATSVASCSLHGWRNPTPGKCVARLAT